MKKTQPLNIVFFGTPEFGKIILERLIKASYKPILVVTAPEKPTGRKQTLTPPPVKILAQEQSIPVAQPKRLSRAVLDNLNPSGSDPASGVRPQQIDLLIVAAYGKAIPKEILDIPKHGALNVHPSLLPRWRGPSPIQYTILNGDKETGVTIMLMDQRLDHGPILAQHKLKPSGSDPDGFELSEKLANLGADLLVETIPKWISGKIETRKQDHEKATYSKIITKNEGHIDWSKPAEEIERQIRAFTPWPGNFTFWGNMRIKIIKGIVEVKPQQAQHDLISPGQILPINERRLAAQTGKGIFIIEKLQIEGRNEMTAKQFLNGYSNIIGAVLK